MLSNADFVLYNKMAAKSYYLDTNIADVTPCENAQVSQRWIPSANEILKTICPQTRLGSEMRSSNTDFSNSTFTTEKRGDLWRFQMMAFHVVLLNLRGAGILLSLRNKK